MGNTFIVLGALVLLGVAVYYVYTHPQILGELGKSLQRGQQAVEAAKRVEDPARPAARRGGYLSAKATPLKRMPTLPVGTFLTVSIGPGKTAKLQVKGRLSFNTRRQYGGRQSPWQRDGTVWHGLLLSGDPTYFRDDVLLAQFGGQGYVFLDRSPLGPDQAKQQFGAAGAKFADPKGANQEPGSVSLGWRGNTYPIQDLGVYDVETEEGDGHVPQEVLVRFIIATTDTAAVLVEDAKSSDDSVWTGRPIDLTLPVGQGFVREILTPEGE